MPRGQRKRGAFDFTIWFADGSRCRWHSNMPHTDAEIADAIRRYLVPFMERNEAPPTADAVDPHVGSTGTPTPREKDVS